MPLSRQQQDYIKEVKVTVESKTTLPATIVTPPPPQTPSPTFTVAESTSTNFESTPITSKSTETPLTPEFSSISLQKQAEMVLAKGDTVVSSYKPVVVEVSTTPTQESPTSAPTVVPTTAVAPVSDIQLNGDVLFDMVNQYRASLGLSLYEKDEKLCVLAEARANEAYNEIWVTYSMHSGLRNRNLPYRVWENLISQNSESQALTWWQNSYIHNQGLTSDMKYSCCKCNGKSCSLLITSYVPK